MKPITLAIETSGEMCSVAVRDGDGVREDTRRLERSHNEALLGMLDALVPADQRAQVSEVVFGAGPGSFTGVRIGAAAAQAIALVSGAQMRSIDSLQALALVSFQSAGLPSEANRLLVARRSRREAYYLAAYSRSVDGPPVEAARASLVTDARALEMLVESLGSGGHDEPAWHLVGDPLPAHWSLPESVTAVDLGTDDAGQQTVITASVLLQLAELGAADLVAPEHALPRYVGGDHPWVKQAR